MGKRWNQERVSTARRNHKIVGHERNVEDPGVLTMQHAARHCGVSDTTIRRLVDAKIIPMNQVVAWAPWEIKRCDLETEPVKRIVKHRLETGKLVLKGGRLEDQPALPFTNQGSDNDRHCS